MEPNQMNDSNQQNPPTQGYVPDGAQSPQAAQFGQPTPAQMSPQFGQPGVPTQSPPPFRPQTAQPQMPYSQQFGQPGQPQTVEPNPQPQFGASQANYMPPVAPMSHPKRSKKPLVFSLLALVIVAGVAYAAFSFMHKSNTTNSNGTVSSQGDNNSALTSLQSYGAHITGADLSKLNKLDLFYDVFQKASMQNVVSQTDDIYQGGDPTDQTTRAYEFLYQTSFNYHTKQLALLQTDPHGDLFSECVGGHYYDYGIETPNVWAKSSNGDDDCAADSYVFKISDGLNTGGLSASQAKTYVSAIRGIDGLVTVSDMSLATHDGSPYIRLVVNVNPVKVGTAGYEGMGAFIQSFAGTGLSTASWPYLPDGSIISGGKMIYYINPTTQLPAYSQFSLTYGRDNDTGKQVPLTAYTFRDTVYSFGGSVPTLSLTTAPQAFKLSWPEEAM